MKKIYNSPAIETTELSSSPLMTGAGSPNGGSITGGSTDPWASGGAPKPRPYKPF